MTIREAQASVDIRGQKAIWFDSQTREIYFCDKEDLPVVLIPAVVYLELSEKELLLMEEEN